MRRMKIEVKLKNSEDISCISMEIFGCKYKGLRNCSMLLFSFLFYLKEEHILEEIHINKIIETNKRKRVHLGTHWTQKYINLSL